MCARVTSTYMEFTFTFGAKSEFKFSFKYFPEDNFCKMRQWNILEHMFIICNIRSDKTFT